MKNQRRNKVLTYALVWTLLFSTLAFGQDASKAAPAKPDAAEIVTPSYADYLIEVAPGYDTSRTYDREAQAIARVLSSKTGTNPVLIDNHGYARDLVLQSVAARLARDPHGKRLFRVNWNAFLSSTKDQAEFDAILKGILTYVESTKGKTVIYLDDIASFSPDAPMLGSKVAEKLYNALSQGKIQIMSAADADSFNRQIAGDSRLRERFEKVEFAKDKTDDPFVGDKLSPDLRALVAGADQNRTVKVILQSDDIDNPQLLNVLQAKQYRDRRPGRRLEYAHYRVAC